MRERPAWMRRLTPQQEDDVRRAYDKGVRARDLASACGVNVRTIYRTLRRTHRQIRRLEIDGYHATYEIGEEGPVQLTPWRAA